MTKLKEYEPGSHFPGRIGRTLDESEPAWPQPTRAREQSPNIIFFVWDDVGFGQMSAYGGFCETPTLDRLAGQGLRYANFQTTALCSPTRGCLLTGRNHHTLGLSAITELSLGYPAHNGYMGFEHGFLSEMLLEHGYNTFAAGKWHLTPPEETTTAGPFHRWPLGRGFERYYGFLGGDTDQWHPDLTHDNHPVTPPAKPEEGYHLNIDLADRAIEFIKDAKVNAPDKPFFLYYATGAGHAPHHVEKQWIDKYKGRFDMGWDEYRKAVFERQKALGLLPTGAELSDHDPDVPAWDSLPEEARRMYARQMEVYAAFMEQTDHHFGRVMDFVETLGELDNTLVIVISDNGASAEGGVHGTFNEALFFNSVEETLKDNLKHFDDWGGPNTFPHYSWGWTWAGDTPFRRWKRETYRGGTSDPCIVCWPKRIRARGEVRHQYAHVTDIVPTVLAALSLDAPATIRGVPQSPIQGVSFAHTFDDAKAPTRHHTQYFEMFGHRAIYHDGWRAVCPFPGPSFAEAAEQGRFFGMPLSAEILDDLDAHGWELYHVAEDPSERRNVAAEHPDKLHEMVQRWYTEAGRYGVLPLASADMQRMNVARPTVSRPRERYVYYPGGAPVSFAAAPRLYNRPHSITAEVEIPEGGAEGVLMTQGSRNAGYALYVKDGRLHYVHNYVGLELFKVSSVEPLPTGKLRLRYEFEPTGKPDLRSGKGSPGRAQLYMNGTIVGNLEMPLSTPSMFGVLGASCGYAAYDSVIPEDYEAPFPFSGRIDQVVVDVSGDLTRDDQAELKRLMTQQ
ncbi:arylsulfatase [Desulfocurvibacter africanus]|uniref:arylsulfatase n=1 Tax=Desulfocurvibacter africanus TaxID=873 RepID=UPI000419FCB7|nr:arylsulfatase [Desulfocurvibacter africanus]